MAGSAVAAKDDSVLPKPSLLVQGLMVLVVAVAIITIFPQIALYLPRLAFPE